MNIVSLLKHLAEKAQINKDGLMTYSYGIMKNKNGETVHEETKVYTYSL